MRVGLSESSWTISKPWFVRRKRRQGNPTVADRVSQMVVKNRWEPLVEPLYHTDSFIEKEHGVKE